MRKYVFVGFDPGSTVGLVLVDISGKPVKIWSKKSSKTSEIVEEIISTGEPILISIDKKEPSHLAKKIASMFRVRLILQEREPMQMEKQKIVKEILGWSYRNDHERDAAYSAFYAYKKYEGLIEKIKKITSDEEKIGFTLKLVVNNIVPNIKDALRLLEPKEKMENRGAEIKESKEEKRFRDVVQPFLNEISILRKILGEKNREIEVLKKTIERIKEQKNKETKVKILSDKEKLDRLNIIENEVSTIVKNINTILARGKVPVIYLNRFDEKVVNLLARFIAFEDVIIVHDKEPNVNYFIKLTNKEAEKYFGKTKEKIIPVDQQTARKIQKEVIKNRVNRWLREYRKR